MYLTIQENLIIPYTMSTPPVDYYNVFNFSILQCRFRTPYRAFNDQSKRLIQFKHAPVYGCYLLSFYDRHYTSKDKHGEMISMGCKQLQKFLYISQLFMIHCW